MHIDQYNTRQQSCRPNYSYSKQPNTVRDVYAKLSNGKGKRVQPKNLKKSSTYEHQPDPVTVISNRTPLTPHIGQLDKTAKSPIN